MYLVSEEQAASLLNSLSREQIIDLSSSLESTLAQFWTQTSNPNAEKLIHQPLRSVIATNSGLSSVFMPASTTDFSGIKIVSIPPASDLVAYINLFDAEGKLVGLISAAELTAWRTALATMSLFLRTRLPKKNIVVFGAGKQAEWHARLAAILYPDEVAKITFVNRSRARAEKTSHLVAKSLDGAVQVEILTEQENKDYQKDLRSLLEEADVILSCTPSTSPLFPHELLGQRSRFISLIGSYKPHMQEVDQNTIRSGKDSKVYTDLAEACLEEAGELIKAGMTKEDLIDIGEVFASNTKDISVSSGQNVIFKCVGFGLMDVAITRLVIELAKERGFGTEVPNF